jgi:hypothetical protein
VLSQSQEHQNVALPAGSSGAGGQGGRHYWTMRLTTWEKSTGPFRVWARKRK